MKIVCSASSGVVLVATVVAGVAMSNNNRGGAVVNAFVAVVSPQQKATRSTSTNLFSTAESSSEAERLLRKARELRQQAELEEKEVHSTLVEKKSQQEEHLDGLIEYILESSSSSNKNTVDVVVQRLNEKHVSMETLEHLVDRLDDRLAIAEGEEHVNLELNVVSKKRDETLMASLKSKLDSLLEAVQVLDADFRKAHGNKVVGGVAGDSSRDSDGSGSLIYSVSNAEYSHWGGGHAHDILTQRLHEKQRAREEQFQKRQEEFYEAQRVKKGQKVDKVKDDHGFLP